jgi:hypothetical protein
MYDYYLGGSNHRAVDREVADRALAVRPEITEIARANRAFLGRVVRFLAAAGIGQFIDIGAGLPTQDNVHQVVQRITSDATVLYVDNDPAVIGHGRTLLETSDTAHIIQGDLLQPAAILAHPRLEQLIDFNRPVAILILAVLHFIPDDDRIRQAIRHLHHGLAPGSHVAISCGISETLGQDAQSLVNLYQGAGSTHRTTADVSTFFDGLELLDPGLVPLPRWRPDGPVPAHRPEHMWIIGGIGRKPDRR